jgi:hypothetical protein
MSLLDGVTGDRDDPAVRAAAQVARRRRRRREAGTVMSTVLLGLAVLVLVLAAADGGAPAWISATLAAVLCGGLAVVAWPRRWPSAEREHHELEAVWAQARGEAGLSAPWERYAAWAIADDRHVRLVALRCAPADDPAPNRITAARRRRLDGSDIAGATAAMEALRDELAAKEEAARRARDDRRTAAAQRAHDAALAAIDAEAADRLRVEEAAMRAELAAERTAEEQAQAAAVARALRRP